MNKAVKQELQMLEILGLSAMPLNGKKPIVNAWQEESTEKLYAQIKKGENFGIRTGAVSGCIVVDIDVKDRGLEVWDKISANQEPIETYRVRTGSGGLHLYFAYEGTQGIKNGTKVVKVAGEKVGIDVKNDAGQVVGALSIHPDTKKMYEAEVPMIEWSKKRTKEKKELFAKLPDWLRSLIVGDTELDSDYNIIRVEKPAPKKEVEQDQEHLVTLGITPEFLEKLVMECIKPARADDTDEWRSICFGLSHAAAQYKLKGIKEIAHTFSKQSEKYTAKDGRKAVDNLWKEDQPKGKKVNTLGTVRHFANLDNPELYKVLCADLTMPEHAPPTCWEDLPKIRSSKPTLVGLMMYYRGCLFEVRGHGSVQYFARSRSGKIVPIDTPFMKSRGENPTIPLAGDTSVSLHSAFEDLQNTPLWYEHNTFDRVDILPSFTEKIQIPRVLNLFMGYACKPLEGTSSDVEKFDWHMKQILCAGNEEFYQMIEFWHAHLVQHPSMKIEIMPMFLGEQGTGKSMVFDKLYPLLLGDEFCIEIDDMNQLFDKFNADQQGKNVCLLNEIGTYGKDHGQSGKLKSRLTRKKMAVEHKGKNRYEVPDSCNYILLSNKSNPVKIEVSNRRYAPITASSEKIGDKNYFVELNKAMNPKTVSHLLHRWLNIDLSKWVKQNIPQTDALQYMKDMSLPSVERFMIDVASDETSVLEKGQLKMHSATLYQHYSTWARDQGETPTPQKVFSAELVKMKVPYGNVRVDGEQKKGFSATLDVLQGLIRAALREPNRSFQAAKLDVVEELE